MVRVSNPGRDRIFFSCPQCPNGCGVKSSFMFSGYRSFSPGVRRPGREVGNSYSSVEVKWSYILCSPCRFSWRGHVTLFFRSGTCCFPPSNDCTEGGGTTCASHVGACLPQYGVTHQNALIDAVSVADVLCSPHFLVL